VQEKKIYLCSTWIIGTLLKISSLQEKEYLPVRALYFGDTGTPLDRKEARFNLGPLECHGDTLFTHSVTFRRQVCGVFFLYRGPELDCKNLSSWGFS
jgi:hypothetical protein